MFRHGLYRSIRPLRAALSVDSALLALRPEERRQCACDYGRNRRRGRFNIKRKEREAEETYNSMIEHMKDLNVVALHGGTVRNKTIYNPTVPMFIPDFLKVVA